MIDYSKLRAAAKAAPTSEWHLSSVTDPHMGRAVVVGNHRSAIWCGIIDSAEAYSITEHVAAASPATILALLDELDALRAQIKPAKMKRGDYPADFMLAYRTAKWRSGSTPAAAFTQWKARMNAGATVIEMQAGTEKYARYCIATGCEVKQAQTFFGPGEHFTADWTISASAQKGKPNGSIGQQDYSAGVGDDGSF